MRKPLLLATSFSGGLAPTGEQTIELMHSPPGAACIPTPLVLVPFKS
jgi:hypothetical protein